MGHQLLELVGIHNMAVSFKIYFETASLHFKALQVVRLTFLRAKKLLLLLRTTFKFEVFIFTPFYEEVVHTVFGYLILASTVFLLRENADFDGVASGRNVLERGVRHSPISVVRLALRLRESILPSFFDCLVPEALYLHTELFEVAKLVVFTGVRIHVIKICM